MTIQLRHIIRLVVFMIIQAVLLKRIYIGEGAFNHIHFFLYPLAIMMMPFNISKVGLLFMAFTSGLVLDFFYDSPGVNAGASVLLAYSRWFLFKVLEPRGGYAMSSSPTSYSMGANWFFSYLAMGTFIYIFAFFNFHAFSFVFLIQVIIKTFFSFIFTMIIMGVYTLIFNPKT
jgi:hypothetical protein